MHDGRNVRTSGTWASVAPGTQVIAALAVLVPVALSGLALVALAPGLWWIFTTYFWISFPAFGLLTRGLAGLSGSGGIRPGGASREREILEALRENDELTPARAAMETSLTVAEADGVLKGLAEGGHLEVRVRGGALSYALWEGPEASAPRGGIPEYQGSRGLKLLEPGGNDTEQYLERSGR